MKISAESIITVNLEYEKTFDMENLNYKSVVLKKIRKSDETTGSRQFSELGIWAKHGLCKTTQIKS